MKNPYLRGIVAFIVSWAVYTVVHIWVYGPIQKAIKHKYLATHSQFIDQAHHASGLYFIIVWNAIALLAFILAARLFIKRNDRPSGYGVLAAGVPTVVFSSFMIIYVYMLSLFSGR